MGNKEIALVFGPDCGVWSEHESLDFVDVTGFGAVLAFDPKIFELLSASRDMEFETYFYLDLLRKAHALDELGNLTWEVARKWWDVNEARVPSLLSYQGVNCAEVDELWFGASFARVLRNSIVLNAFSHENVPIKCIYCYSSDAEFTEILKRYCEVLGIKFRSKGIEVPWGTDSKGAWTRFISALGRIGKAFFSEIATVFAWYFIHSGYARSKTILAQSHRNVDPVIAHLLNNHSFKVFSTRRHHLLSNSNNKREVVMKTALFMKVISVLGAIVGEILAAKRRKQLLAGCFDAISRNILDLLPKDIGGSKVFNIALKDLLRRYCTVRLGKAIREIVIAKWLFRCIKPGIIFLSTYVGLSQRILIYIAKKCYVPTIAAEHGLMIPARWSSDIIYTDYLGAWGEATVDSYDNLSERNHGKCVVTGNAAIKDITIERASTAKKSSQVITIAPPPLHALSERPGSQSTWSPVSSVYHLASITYEISKAVENLVAQGYEVNLAIHPMDRIEWWKKSLGNNVISISQGKIEKLLPNTDVLIGHNSTIEFDGLINGCEVIEINPFWDDRELQRYSIGYVKQGVAHLARTADEIVDKVDSILAGHAVIDKAKKEEYVKEVLKYRGKESLDRWVEFLENMM